MRKVAFGAALFVVAAIPAFLGQKASAEASQKPKTKPKIVVVRAGDSLSKIAKRHRTTYKRIYDANTKIKHPDLIYPNDKLRIPRKDEKLKKRSLSGEVPVTSPKRRTVKSAPQSAWKPLATPVVADVGGSVWDKLAACESGGNWSINTGNGYYGGLQFSAATWRAVGGRGYPHQASKAEQIKRGQILQARSGWGQWPACAARLRLL